MVQSLSMPDYVSHFKQKLAKLRRRISLGSVVVANREAFEKEQYRLTLVELSTLVPYNYVIHLVASTVA